MPQTKTHYEIKAEKNKNLSTLGYGIMWLFVALLVGLLPFYTGNANSIFYLTGGLSFAVGIYKLIKGSRALSSDQY
ncbi:hypothetical protein E1176_17225 [Fulvivirga sp. RKSG066]|uniref:hypothetical protein n=1 Tax=Fulvivirga aurantia TaxID=2529383 RepID=UPI0012BC9380|nr:hypothetical protein [Fulvivirga aurantia]MTI22777.1 hypothetical protein [Fulvivirga aurantia]